MIAAGHNVDPVVTADTRRIIRVPGTLHGSTGWTCSILREGQLERPVSEWISEMPKHEMASKIPRRPQSRFPALEKQEDSCEGGWKLGR